MSALFENGILGSNKPAWHGAGTVLPDDTFNWETVKRHVPELGYHVDGLPLYAIRADGKPIRLDDFVANVRADGSILGVVGSGYVAVQGNDAFAFLDALHEDGGPIVHTAGTLDGGRKAWIQCFAPDSFRVAGEETEEHRGYLTFLNSFDGSTKVGAITGATRVVCMNTYNAAMSGAENAYWFKHTANVMDRVAEARMALKIGRAYWAELERIANVAIRMPFSDHQFTAVRDTIIPTDDGKGHQLTGRKLTNAEAERATLSRLWADSATIRNVDHTAWAAVNVFTEYSDHLIGSKNTGRNDAAANRLKRVWFDTSIKDSASELIYTMAEVQ